MFFKVGLSEDATDMDTLAQAIEDVERKAAEDDDDGDAAQVIMRV